MFESMISRSLISVLWILMSIGVIIGVIVNYQTIWWPTGTDLVVHLIMAAVGLIIVRVWCEAMIVIFMMHDNLRKSASALENLSSRSFTAPSSYNTHIGDAPAPAPRAGWEAAVASTASTTPASATIVAPRQRGNWSGYSGDSNQ